MNNERILWSISFCIRPDWRIQFFLILFYSFISLRIMIFPAFSWNICAQMFVSFEWENGKIKRVNISYFEWRTVSNRMKFIGFWSFIKCWQWNWIIDSIAASSLIHNIRDNTISYAIRGFRTIFTMASILWWHFLKIEVTQTW